MKRLTVAKSDNFALHDKEMADNIFQIHHSHSFGFETLVVRRPLINGSEGATASVPLDIGESEMRLDKGDGV